MTLGGNLKHSPLRQNVDVGAIVTLDLIMIQDINDSDKK